MRRLVGSVLVAAWALTLGAAPAPAQDFNIGAYQTSSTNVTIPTTTETVIVSSGPASTRRATSNVCVIAWAQVVTGAGATAITPQIRRGTTTSGTAIAEANPETLKAAAGGTEPFWIMACEDRGDVGSVDYNLTLTQSAATGNAVATYYGIIVFIR